MEIQDYILVHGIIANIKDNVDNKFIWFDIRKDEYYKDKDGKMKNNPSFFSVRVSKNMKYKLETNIEIIVKGIPKGFVDKNGERCLYISPGVNDDIKVGEINPLNIMRCKIMHYTSFVGDSFKAQIDLLEKLSKETLLSFDPGMLYVQKGFDELKPILERTDILLINESELRLLCNNNDMSLKELVIGLLDSGIETVVVKQGSKGVYAINSTEECFVEAFECDVVDTTGAGDSFNSGFLYSFLKGFSLEKSCEIGNWVASKSIEGFGMDKFPTLKELNEFF